MSPRDNSVVYRAFNADNDLLYVGVTCQPNNRFNIHEYQTRWWHEVDRVELSQVFPDRQDAEDAEALAIDMFEPLYNRHYPGVPERARSVELRFSPFDYKPQPNYPAVMRRIAAGSLVLGCPTCRAPRPDLMPRDQLLVMGDEPPMPFCTDPYHHPGIEGAARLHANREQLRQRGILRPAEMPTEASA